MYPVEKDFWSWISDLRGKEIEGDNTALSLNYLKENTDVHFCSQKQTARFIINNIDVLRVDPKDGSLFYEYRFPRMADVICGIKGTYTDRVRVSVTIGGQPLDDPCDPVLLIAAQYHEVVIRMSFDRTVLSQMQEFGFEYEALFFQYEQRHDLTQGAWTVEGRCRYQNGIAAMMHAKQN